MEFPTVTKKKKRKTRKCLDEIRKRSRRTKSGVCFVENSQQHEKNNIQGVHTHSHRLVTMNRLTLSVFPRAICSKTITRPALEEIKLKSSYTHTYKDLNKSIQCSSSQKDPEVEYFERHASNNSMPMCDLIESLQDHESSRITTPLRDFQNSQMNIIENPAGLTARIYSTSSTSLSSETLEGSQGHELFEEFMNKISSHLQKVTSAVINEDVLINTKVKLQKLYNRSWSEEYQTCMLKHEKNNKSTATTLKCLKDSIAQKPLDYIRLKCVQQQGMYDEMEFENSETFSSLPSTAASAVSDSPLTFRREFTHDVACYDTPEYNYYPHRLN